MVEPDRPLLARQPLLAAVAGEALCLGPHESPELLG